MSIPHWLLDDYKACKKRVKELEKQLANEKSSVASNSQRSTTEDEAGKALNHYIQYLRHKAKSGEWLKPPCERKEAK